MTGVFDGPAAAALGALLTSPGNYYVEVTSGDLEGHRFGIVSATGSLVTLAADPSLTSATPPFNTLTSPPPAELEGGSLVIRRHHSVVEMFPPSAFGSSGIQTAADEIQIFAGGAWTILWLFDDAGTPRWVDSADSGMTDQGSTILPPGQGLFFNNHNNPSSLLAFGEIRANRSVRTLAAGTSPDPARFLRLGITLPEP